MLPGRGGVSPERLLKLPLEDLREFLQEDLAVSFQLPDDGVVEQLLAAMTELRSMRLDLPPPGGAVTFSAVSLSLLLSLSLSLSLLLSLSRSCI